MFKIHNFLLSGLIFMFWFYQYMLIWLWGFTEEQIRKGISGRQPRATWKKHIRPHIYSWEIFSRSFLDKGRNWRVTWNDISPKNTYRRNIQKSQSNPRNVIALLQVVNPPNDGCQDWLPVLVRSPMAREQELPQHSTPCRQADSPHHFISVGDCKNWHTWHELTQFQMDCVLSSWSLVIANKLTLN